MKVKMSKIFLSLLIFVSFSVSVFAAAESDSSSGDDIVISFAEHIVEPYPFLVGVIEAFEAQNPGVTIEISGIDTDTHKQNIMMAAQANNLPDMFWIDEDLMMKLARQGMLLEVEDLLKANNVDKNMSPDMFNQARVDGVLYGLPSERLITGYWINQSIFDGYNVPLPETFDDLLAAAEVFSANDMITISNAAKSPFSTWAFEVMIGRYGFFDHWENILSGSDSFVNDDFLRFYERIEELADAGAFNPSVATTDYSQAMEVFKGGRSAMVDSGVWLASELEQVDFAQDVLFWFGPLFSDGIGDQKVATMVGGGPYVVSAEVAKDPAKQEAIISFLSFLYGEEGAAIIADEFNALPVSYYSGTPNSEATPAFASVINALNDKTWKSLPNQPSNVMVSAVQTAFYDSIYGVVNQIYSPEEAAQLVQDAIDLK